MQSNKKYPIIRVFFYALELCLDSSMILPYSPTLYIISLFIIRPCFAKISPLFDTTSLVIFLPNKNVESVITLLLLVVFVFGVAVSMVIFSFGVLMFRVILLSGLNLLMHSFLF